MERDFELSYTARKSLLVLGSGAREHALAWKLGQSSFVKHVYISPGNAGTNAKNFQNVELKIAGHRDIIEWSKLHNIDLVVVGPEAPLADGIADDLSNSGIACFGPSKLAAQLESSKLFAKQFMDKHGIPTARWRSFTDVKEAQSFIRNAPWEAHVVKASGLAAGKGVVVAPEREAACKAVQETLTERRFGEAGSTVIVEERLRGSEISCLAITDGTDIACFPPAQDYKRLCVGDSGPNTGGMGAYCPVKSVSDEQFEYIKKEILQKTVDGMRNDGTPYVGTLYAGLMLTADGVRVLEYNCRFGDPETQVLMRMLSRDCDLYAAMRACVVGDLSEDMIRCDPQTCALCVVCASDGYPASYETGKVITGLDSVNGSDQQSSVQVIHAGTKRLPEDGAVLTSGGRVLSVVASANSFTKARELAMKGVSSIQFNGKIYRSDIGVEAVREESNFKRDSCYKMQSLSYAACGVSISAGDKLVERIKPLAKATEVPGCLSGLGGFGGLFDVKSAGFKDPVLVAGADGVGTKLKIAQAVDRHDTVGIDLVAMCVNDVLCHGAQPLFFLDYLASARLEPNTAEQIIRGIAEGCQQAGCALLGGETAEVPGMYEPRVYDLAGFCVGAVERPAQLPRHDVIEPGDVIVGVASSGLHSNGYSMVRRVVEMCGLKYDMTCPWNTSKKLGEALLTPTQIYVKALLPLIREGKIKGCTHITGGGLPGNLPRALPETLGAILDARKWPVLPVFKWIAQNGGVTAEEMARTFNLGLGMALIVARDDAEHVMQRVHDVLDVNVSAVGHVCTQVQAGIHASNSLVVPLGSVHDLNVLSLDGVPRVQIKHLQEVLELTKRPVSPPGGTDELTAGDEIKRHKATDTVTRAEKCKVAVLISGTGTNLQALIDHTLDTAKNSAAEIVLVVSNKSGVEGLSRAQAAGIPHKVISHAQYASREQFDDAVHEELMKAGVQLVCLAGFMRILSGKFVRAWRGRLLNIHPSLLPSFKGLDPHKQVLAAGVRVTGCSVHFVEEEVDAGAILVQETVTLDPADDLERIQTKVKAVEHVAYPRALEMLASGRAWLGDEGRVWWK